MEIKRLKGDVEASRAITYWLTAKSNRWKYEKEIRAISKNKIDYYRFQKNVIKEIIFGCRVTDTKINEVKKVLKRNNYKSDIIIRKMEIDPKTFLLKEKILASI